MNHKILFGGVCAFYALAAIVLNVAGPSSEPAPWQMAMPVAHAPVETARVAGWFVLAGIVLAGLFVMLRLAWSTRNFVARTNRFAFFGMLALMAVFVKFAATKSGMSDGGTPPDLGQPTDNGASTQDGTNNGGQGGFSEPAGEAWNESPDSTPAGIVRAGDAGGATQPAYVFDTAGLSSHLTTNFFAGRLYADPHTMLSRDGSHTTFAFAPAQPLDDDADTPVGALLSFYDLPADIQAVVILANLDGLRAPSCATLLRSPNLLVQQAEENVLDLETIAHCRFLSVGAGRRMLVNNTETLLVPRDGWAVISVEAGPANPIDMTSVSLGADDSPSFGGAYWPGRVAEFVFIPRAWQPGPGAPPVAIPWDATLRNALESYLWHKHRFALASSLAIPPGFEMNHVKMDLVETVFGLPRVKIHGTLFMVR